MTGFAVIDLETTGFAYTKYDRICEVGVVLVDPDGRREHAYTTLVNPQRDLGAQHVHGIDAAEAGMAPTFEQIVGDLTDLLAGRVVVAHNSAFDTAFLVAEYGRAGWPLDLTRDMTLCTMRMAGQLGGPAKLGDCCAYFGVPHHNAHAALADAEATAGLLAEYRRRSGSWHGWTRLQELAEEFRWPVPPRLVTPPVPRGVSAPSSGVLQRVAARFAPVNDVEGAGEYLDLLDRVLQDRKVSTAERRALDGLVAALGLGADDVARLNRHYMRGVVEAVCADDRFTPDERALVVQLAGLLDLDALEVAALVGIAEESVSSIVTEVDLEAGDLVVLTGFSEARKRELTAIAEARGLVVWSGVKKGVAAVIAQDPGSDSGKARKAREYGIPVVEEGVLA